MRDDELHLKGYHIGSEGNRIVSDFWQLQIGHAHRHLHRTANDAQTEKKTQRQSRSLRLAGLT